MTPPAAERGTASAGGRLRDAAATTGIVGAALAGAAALGFVLFCLLFKAGVLGGISILFYRGLALAVLAAVLTAALTAAAIVAGGHPALTARDAIAAAIVSFSLNVAFLIVVPVTVDRSISVFMLGRLAAGDDRLQTADELRRAFIDLYVGEHRQIERRIEEQLLSGNIERVGDTYRLTPQGEAFMRTAKVAAWLFDADPRFVSPAPGKGRREAPALRP